MHVFGGCWIAYHFDLVVCLFSTYAHTESNVLHFGSLHLRFDTHHFCNISWLVYIVHAKPIPVRGHNPCHQIMLPLTAILNNDLHYKFVRMDNGEVMTLNAGWQHHRLIEIDLFTFKCRSCCYFYVLIVSSFFSYFWCPQGRIFYCFDFNIIVRAKFDIHSKMPTIQFTWLFWISISSKINSTLLVYEKFSDK